jgi:hypothetical protein
MPFFFSVCLLRCSDAIRPGQSHKTLYYLRHFYTILETIVGQQSAVSYLYRHLFTGEQLALIDSFRFLSSYLRLSFCLLRGFV